MNSRVHDIYTRYNTELKPLIAEQEMRMAEFEEPLLLNLSMMFDSFSVAQTEDEDASKMLDAMENALLICISQSYMYIATSIKEDIKQFEKNNAKSVLKKLNGGTFIGQYKGLKNEIKQIDKKCKSNKDDFILHLDDYKMSYEKCTQLEELITSVNDTEILLHTSKKSLIWPFVRFVFTLLISLYFVKYVIIYIKSILVANGIILEWL